MWQHKHFLFYSEFFFPICKIQQTLGINQRHIKAYYEAFLKHKLGKQNRGNEGLIITNGRFC